MLNHWFHAVFSILRTIPQSATLTAPFTQGSLNIVDFARKIFCTNSPINHNLYFTSQTYRQKENFMIYYICQTNLNKLMRIGMCIFLPFCKKYRCSILHVLVCKKDLFGDNRSYVFLMRQLRLAHFLFANFCENGGKTFQSAN